MVELAGQGGVSPKTSRRVSSQRRVVTPEMIAAGVSVLYWGDGEASKECLAEEVFLAMAPLAPSFRPRKGRRVSKGDD